MDLSDLQTVRVRFDGPVCYLQLYRPEARNTINARMVVDCRRVLDACEAGDVRVVVVEGLPQVFCFGADFGTFSENALKGREDGSGAAAVYDLWHRLASGPFVSVANVQGSVNAGGNGFVAACDLVIAEPTVRFSLSELLFGLFPACVMPFLVRKVGLQRAHYLALSTLPISADEAHRWGLVDRICAPGEPELHRHLQRLRRLRRDSVAMYKRYVATLPLTLAQARDAAITNNREMHELPGVIGGIVRYVETSRLPWEDDPP
jgi:3-carboxymethyl-3-hydroxy-acyl-[acp] dehydratase